MQVLSLSTEVESFDILDAFNKVFWKDMDRATALEASSKLGTMYRVVAATGLGHGAKVA
ncbi:hypothetical protein [Pseudarthrobacter sp. NIBRBAC000502772]|uniref:hypothetical protein n=1 Tax=Pseudarthrobacter sp. NIBRBAC000502772 TaxID=2590775 RepID=UPI00143D5EE1|nr:hypothetical protein [Pseudarthrobacter sp. NIBRBAC000502772]